MRSGPESPFWHIKGMSVVDHVGEYADVPVLHITGWYDSWTRQVTMNYEALSPAKKSPQRLVIGPWVHGSQGSNVAGEVEFTPDAAIDLLRLPAALVRPLDARARRTASTTIHRSCSTSWGPATTADRPRAGSSTADTGGREREWPLARSRPASLYLHGDGQLVALGPLASIPSSHDLHLRPATPGPDDRRQHLVEPGA